MSMPASAPKYLNADGSPGGAAISTGAPVRYLSPVTMRVVGACGKSGTCISCEWPDGPILNYAKCDLLVVEEDGSVIEKKQPPTPTATEALGDICERISRITAGRVHKGEDYYDGYNTGVGDVVAAMKTYRRDNLQGDPAPASSATPEALAEIKRRIEGLKRTVCRNPYIDDPSEDINSALDECIEAIEQYERETNQPASVE